MNAYAAFFPMHNIPVQDDPDGRSPHPVLALHDIWSLPEHQLKMRALPFIFFCLLMIVDNDASLTDPWERFRCFLTLVEEHVGIFSEKELCIASIVLGDFRHRCPELLDDDDHKLIKSVENNFARRKKWRRPKTREDVYRIAFNAACDITMLNVAVMMDGRSLGKNEPSLDIWFVTSDVKLRNFLTQFFCYRVLVDGQNGMFAEVGLSKGLEVAMLANDAEVFAMKAAYAYSHKVAKFHSDLWLVRLRQVLELVDVVFPPMAAVAS
jgi:hypothetical protein